MSTLQLTNQIKEEIIKEGLNLTKTVKQLEEIAATIPSDKAINYCNIETHKEKTAFIWVIHHDPKINKYDYLSDNNGHGNGHAWTVNAHYEKNTKKIINNLIELTTKKSNFLKTCKPVNGYKMEQLPNNKPLTLINAINNNFVSFICVKHIGGYYLKYNEIGINEETKKEYAREFFNMSSNCCDARTVRKECDEIFAIYNKQMPQYLEARKQAAEKRNQRANNQPQKEYKKYSYTDKDLFNDLMNYKNCLHFYNGFSHNSLLKHEFDTVAPGSYISYKGKEYPKTTEPMTRQQFFNMVVDKSGYFVLDYRYNLEQRAEQLKRQREQERREKAQNEWINSDHTEQADEIKRYMQALKINYILPCLGFDELLKDNSIKKMQILKDTYKELGNLLNFDKFSAEKWQDKKADILKEWDFNQRVIDNNLFDVIACQHMYEKVGNKYTMKEEYKKDHFWGSSSRYIQEF